MALIIPVILVIWGFNANGGIGAVNGLVGGILLGIPANALTRLLPPHGNPDRRAVQITSSVQASMIVVALLIGGWRFSWIAAPIALLLGMMVSRKIYNPIFQKDAACVEAALVSRVASDPTVPAKALALATAFGRPASKALDFYTMRVGAFSEEIIDEFLRLQANGELATRFPDLSPDDILIRLMVIQTGRDRANRR